MKSTTLIAATAALPATLAHTIFVQLKSGGTTYPISHGIRTPTYDGPITNVASNDLACNGGPNPTTPSSQIITVTAGSTVTAVWRHTLTSGSGDVMDASHKGPTIAYLKKVSNALTDTGIGGGWFKIQEKGYSNGNWGTSEVITNGGLHTIDIPSCIENGQYLLRAEMIALHGAGSSGGAQLYMECAQINIVGGTSSAKPQTYSIPGIYKATDPGILISIYSMTPSSTYVIPGPPKFSCSGGGSSSPQPTEPEPQPQPTQQPGGGSGGCEVAKYGQCGGLTYSGCTTCASGSTCKKSSDHYSQCL